MKPAESSPLGLTVVDQEASAYVLNYENNSIIDQEIDSLCKELAHISRERNPKNVNSKGAYKTVLPTNQKGNIHVMAS